MGPLKNHRLAGLCVSRRFQRTNNLDR